MDHKLHSDDSSAENLACPRVKQDVCLPCNRRPAELNRLENKNHSRLINEAGLARQSDQPGLQCLLRTGHRAALVWGYETEPLPVTRPGAPVHDQPAVPILTLGRSPVSTYRVIPAPTPLKERQYHAPSTSRPQLHAGKALFCGTVHLEGLEYCVMFRARGHHKDVPYIQNCQH
ncbi:hypothetical protein Bbelb_206870 [Branchiostoma belcheri]|nr:hypothetical protein Bbelb_206870 [Branchiostoma belcheri]